MSSDAAHSLIATHHTFLWNKSSSDDTYESRILQKYDESFFKEYCIGDLSNYEKNKLALRWRTKKEVISGKGEFICGEKQCNEKENLKAWEVNFKYIEQGVYNNALVKIKLCEICSLKLAYYKKNNADYQKHEVVDKSKPMESHSKECNPSSIADSRIVDSRNSVLKGTDIFQGEDFSTADSMDLYLNDLL